MPDNRASSRQETFLERVDSHELPPTLEILSSEYDAHIGQRDPFLWKWIHVLLPYVTLSTVPPEHAERARNVKTATSMLVVLLDDLGERTHDKTTLTEATKVPFENRAPDPDTAGVDVETVAVAERIWSVVDDLLDGPRCDEFAEVFAFDLDRTITAIEYSYLLNRNPEMASLEEAWLYDSYNMMLFPYVDIDLMFSPSFDRADLGALRKGVRRAQRMARIGNWITTWERELEEGDFASGVVASALEQGIVSVEELSDLRDDHDVEDLERIVDRIERNDVEAQFLRQWETEHQEARAYVDEIDSIDFGDYLDGMETVMEFHLASRGLK